MVSGASAGQTLRSTKSAQIQIQLSGVVLENFVWRRVIRWWMRLRRWTWKDVRRHLIGPNGRWRRPTADVIELFNIKSVPVTRYRYRGNTIPNPWTAPNHA